MKREEMLQMLHSVPFTLIDPAREWTDIGFTERDIWVNSKGNFDDDPEGYLSKHPELLIKEYFDFHVIEEGCRNSI